MTAIEKGREALYFLSKLRDQAPSSEEFSFLLSAFLTATRSVLDHLLSDYAEHYGILLKQVGIRAFRKRAMKGREDAQDFGMWFENSIDELRRNARCGFLLDLRHVSVHKRRAGPRRFRMNVALGSIPAGGSAKFELGDALWGEGRIRSTTTDATGKVVAEEALAPAVEAYFEQNAAMDARAVCEDFLEQVARIVQDAANLFPRDGPL